MTSATCSNLTSRVGTAVCALALVMGASQAVHVYGWLQACWLVGAMAAMGSTVVVAAHSIRPLRPLTMVRATVAWSFVMLSVTGWLHAGARGAMVLVVLLFPVAFAPVGAVLSRRRARKAACASSARPSAGSITTLARLAVPSPGEPSEVLSVPDELQVDDLCRAWRSSYLGLQAAGSVDSLLRAVHVRRVLLDELERLDPAAFEAWLRSRPRAAGNPGRHFHRPAGARGVRSQRGGHGGHPDPTTRARDLGPADAGASACPFGSLHGYGDVHDDSAPRPDGEDPSLPAR